MNVRTIEEERELEEKKEAELKERVTKQVEKSTEYYSTTQKKKGKLHLRPEWFSSTTKRVKRRTESNQ